jgi:hypothetical protein
MPSWPFGLLNSLIRVAGVSGRFLEIYRVGCPFAKRLQYTARAF